MKVPAGHTANSDKILTNICYGNHLTTSYLILEIGMRFVILIRILQLSNKTKAPATRFHRMLKLMLLNVSLI